MIKIENKADCCGCKSCEQVCPVRAISMENDEEGFWYPQVDLKTCIDCEKCKKTCPEINPCKVSEKSEAYAAYRKNLDLRLKSQSGGLFSVFAEKVILDGGVVFGAAFDTQWRVIHKSVRCIDELYLLRGSKYVQSDICNTYQEAESFLKEGRTVLFSGTPCQIQGLKRYLDTEYDKLITIDLICHGVPSPEIWNAYLEEFVGKNNILKFQQKDKKRKNAIVYTLKSGKEKVEAYEENLYSKGFYKDLFLRPSCHQCSFKGIERASDITLGDFWGIDRLLPEFGDRYGVSSAIIHTGKGKKIYQEIRNEIYDIKCDTKWVGIENPCLFKSIPINEYRRRFFEQRKEDGVIYAIHKLTRTSVKEKKYLELLKKRVYVLDLVSVVKRRIFKKH